MKGDGLRRVEAELGLTPPGDERGLPLAFPFTPAGRTRTASGP